MQPTLFKLIEILKVLSLTTRLCLAHAGQIFSFMLVNSQKIVPLPALSLSKIQFLLILTSSEGKLSHLDLVLLLIPYHKVP